MIGTNMFAYCLNNPVNSKDPLGHQSVGSYYEDPAGWLGSEIGRWISEMIEKRKQELEEKKKQANAVTFVPNSSGGGQVTNSFTITNWSDIYQYSCNLKQQYPEQFKGSPEGMAVEWVAHNVACYIPFLDLDRAKDVDFGATIFDDSHAGMNMLMWATYAALFPQQYQNDLQASLLE